jgi:hypothetical protein
MLPVKTAAHLVWLIVFWKFVANTNANGEHCIMDPVAEHVNKRIVERKQYRELDDFERRDPRYQFGPWHPAEETPAKHRQPCERSLIWTK